MFENKRQALYLLGGFLILVFGLAVFSYSIYLSTSLIYMSPGDVPETSGIISLFSPLSIGGGIFLLSKARQRKRGQVAMEFMMTYGWAVLAAVATLGALAYFGVFDTSQLVEEEAFISHPLYASAWNAESGSDLLVNIEIVNEGVAPLDIQDAVLEGRAGNSYISCEMIKLPEYLLTVIKSGPGSAAATITIKSKLTETLCSDSQCQKIFPEGTWVNISVSSGNPTWAGCVGGALGGICKVNMTSNKTIRATYLGGVEGGGVSLSPEEEYIIGLGKSKAITLKCDSNTDIGSLLKGDLIVNYTLAGGQKEFISTGSLTSTVVEG